MTPVSTYPPVPLPLPGSRPTDARPYAPPDAWLRELQIRARAMSWFPAPLRAADCAAGMGCVRTVSSMAEAFRTTGAPVAPAAIRFGAPEVARAGCVVAGSGMADVRGNEPRIWVGREAAPAAAPDQTDRQPAFAHESNTRQSVRATQSGPQGRACAPAREPGPPPDPGVRLHVELGPDGTHVWLGVDAHDAQVAVQAAALAAGLIATSATGPHRLAALVCNGTALYEAAPFFPHQEQPWPSAH